MSVHISAKQGEIAPVVLMPGDPLRAKHISGMLEGAKLVSSTRNIYFFTGTYQGKRVTVAASGMGCPSIGIYSYELYNEYGVECIMRVGTCGAYLPEIQLFDLINTATAYSESTYAQTAFGFMEDHFQSQGNAFDIINKTAVEMGIPLTAGPIHSGDAFYRAVPGLPPIAVKNNCLAAEMEAFALFANAKHFGKTAATLLTVSDNIITHKQISAEERERALIPMMKLALATAAIIDN